MFARKQPFVLPEMKPVDYDALFKKHSWTDRSEVDIEQYLTPKERAEMCDYEKDRLRNIKKNYDVMIELGIPAKKPYFMIKNRPDLSKQVSESSSESDGEWVPSKQRPKATKNQRRSWKPPAPKKKVENLNTSTKTTVNNNKKKVKVDKDAICSDKAKSKNATTPKILEMFQSDSEEEDTFEGFTEKQICESEARTKMILQRNEELLKALESVSACSELEDDDDSEEESPESILSEDKTSEGDVSKSAPPPEPAPECRQRYPRRNLTRKDYKEDELPKDDDYLYCEECDHDYEGDCPIHGPLLVIPDTKVANDGSDPNRAEHSLPKGLVVRKSQIPMAGDGVWAVHAIPKGVRFGPYEGVKVEDADDAHMSGYCWVIFKDGKEVSHYVDAASKSYANWLRYVNCARNEAEQNLLAYQFHGEIYYRTVQSVKPGNELLVWYGEEYARELGLFNETDVQQLFHSAGFELWRCEVCLRVFPSETWRDSHRRQHGDRTGSKRHKCQQCNYSSDHLPHYNQHMRTHTGEKPHVCGVCGQGFSRSGHLKTHTYTHTGERPHVCGVCGQGFSQSSDLKRHTYTHTGERPHVCGVCGQGFSTSGHLKTHTYTHTGERPHVCGVCGQGFSQSGHLKKHTYTHTGERLHVCGVCGQGFSQSGHLKRHTYTHTGERPHVCGVCGQGFSTSGHLKTHTYTHTGERPHVCGVCGQGFSQSGHLKKHTYTHTGEQPHKCSVCDKGFARPSHLRQHIQKCQEH